MSAENVPSVDWALFDQFPPNEIECQCGVIYKSHSKHVRHEGRFVGITRIPCPGCGKTWGHTRRTSSPPESYTLKRTP